MGQPELTAYQTEKVLIREHRIFNAQPNKPNLSALLLALRKHLAVSGLIKSHERQLQHHYFGLDDGMKIKAAFMELKINEVRAMVVLYRMLIGTRERGRSITVFLDRPAENWLVFSRVDETIEDPRIQRLTTDQLVALICDNSHPKTLRRKAKALLAGAGGEILESVKAREQSLDEDKMRAHFLNTMGHVLD
jgi:hypothetical protein